jgi:hypothetical protein
VSDMADRLAALARDLPPPPRIARIQVDALAYAWLRINAPDRSAAPAAPAALIGIPVDQCDNLPSFGWRTLDADGDVIDTGTLHDAARQTDPTTEESR